MRDKKYPKIRPVSDFVYVTKCILPDWRYEDGNVLIYRRETGFFGKEFHNWARIWDVGPRCKKFTRREIGKFVLCPECSTGIHRLEDEDYAIREALLESFVMEAPDGAS